MKNQNSFVRNTSLFATLLIILTVLYPSFVFASAGNAIFVLGKVDVISPAGTTLKLKKGMNVNSGDKIVTYRKGQVMIKMTDNSKITVRPDSTLIVKDYKYYKTQQKDKAHYEILAGTFRSITGAIGKSNKKAFKLKMPVGTMGIRGTDFVARYGKDGFYVDVNNGGVRIRNGNGSIDVSPGDFGHIGRDGSAPVFTEQLPDGMTIFAKDDDENAASQEEEMSAIAIRDSEGDTRGAIGELVRAGLPSQAIIVGGEAMGMEETEVIEQLIESSPDSTQLMEQLIEDMPDQAGNILTMGIAKNKLNADQATSIMKSRGGDAKVLDSAIALGNLMAPSEKDKEERRKEREDKKNQIESSEGGTIRSKVEAAPVEESTTDPQLIPGSGTGGGEDASPS